MKKLLLGLLGLAMITVAHAQTHNSASEQYLQCMPIDMSADFNDLSNTYFLADSLAAFDPQKAEGLVQWDLPIPAS